MEDPERTIPSNRIPAGGENLSMTGTATDYLRLFVLAGMIVCCAYATPHAMTIDGEKQLSYADTLFNNKQYLRAGEEYQRFTFFFPDHPKVRTAHFRAAESFLLAKKMETAIAILKPLVSIEPMDSVSTEAYFLLAECYLQLNAPSHAVVQLNNIITLSDDPQVVDRAYYRISWIHIKMADWERADKVFQRMSDDGRKRHGVARLREALAGADDIPSKSPALSGTLSIIPGGGQLYCQRYEDALIAFALNAGFIWAASDAFDNEQYGLGGLLSFVGLGFYLGNIYSAVNDAHKYNRAQTGRFVDQLRRHQIRIPGPSSATGEKRGIVLGLKIPF